MDPELKKQLDEIASAAMKDGPVTLTEYGRNRLLRHIIDVVAEGARRPGAWEASVFEGALGGWMGHKDDVRRGAFSNDPNEVCAGRW